MPRTYVLVMKMVRNTAVKDRKSDSDAIKDNYKLRGRKEECVDVSDGNIGAVK